MQGYLYHSISPFGGLTLLAPSVWFDASHRNPFNFSKAHLLWMDEILHHFETMGNHNAQSRQDCIGGRLERRETAPRSPKRAMHLLVFTGESSFQGFLGGAGFCPSTVGSAPPQPNPTWAGAPPSPRPHFAGAGERFAAPAAAEGGRRPAAHRPRAARLKHSCVMSLV